MTTDIRYGKLTTAAAVSLLLLGLGGAAVAQVANTKHNLGSTSAAGNNQVAETDEVCVFCHTPHGANTSVNAPLWNKTLPGTTYATYADAGSGSLDGEVVTVGSVSLACLSCHDGTQAMDVMINEPGSGSETIATFTWSGANQTGGALAAGVISNLGSDLTNDHPIGIPYGGGVTGGTTTTDPDFVTPFNDATAGIWWVDTAGGTAGTREKTDMILYTRNDFTVGSSTQPSVECGSCHDPHTADNPTFLRIANSGSGVCLACHVK